MKGKNLKCGCGQGASDVSPEVEIHPGEAVQWRCHSGHLLITGWRELTGRHEQMQFAPPKPK
jgi:hypothetical protein